MSKKCVTTGLPAYSDTLGMMGKCHCKRVSLYPAIFCTSLPAYSDILLAVTVFRSKFRSPYTENHWLVTLTYNDTFASSQWCHCKRADLYKEIQIWTTKLSL